MRGLLFNPGCSIEVFPDEDWRRKTDCPCLQLLLGVDEVYGPLWLITEVDGQSQ